MRAYSEYKDSGIEWLGGIPSHWGKTRLKWCIKIKNGQDYKSVEANSSLKSYPVIGSGGEFARATEFLHDGESILLGRKGTIDKPIYINDKFWTVDTMFYSKISTNSDGKYLFYSTLTIPFGYYQTNTTIPSMTQDDLGNHFISLPEKYEQIEIRSYLDRETGRIDKLITEKQNFIKLLKEKRQALISHVVTKGLDPNVKMKDSGVEWIGKVPEGWGIKPLKHIVSTRKGVAFKSTDFCKNGVQVIKVSDIKDKTLRTSDTYLPEKFKNLFPKAVLFHAEIILSTVGSLPEIINSAVGQIGYVPKHLEGSLLNQNTVVFTALRQFVLPEYLLLILQLPSYREHLDLNAHGTANQASLNITDMLDFSFYLPVLTGQQDIIDTLNTLLIKLKRLDIETKIAIDLLKEHRTALISAAVTGKIDVRDHA